MKTRPKSVLKEWVGITPDPLSFMKKYKWVDTIWINSRTQEEESHRICLNEDEPHSLVYIKKTYGSMFKWDDLKLHRVVGVVTDAEELDDKFWSEIEYTEDVG